MKNKILIIISIVFLLASCTSFERRIIKNSFVLENIDCYSFSNVYYLDNNSLLLGYKYIVHLNENGIKLEQIEWKNNLFDTSSVIFLKSNGDIIGLNEKRQFVIGDLKNKECSIMQDRQITKRHNFFISNEKLYIESHFGDSVTIYSLNEWKKEKTMKNASLSYGNILDIKNDRAYFSLGGIGKKGLFFSDKNLYNYLLEHNLKTGEVKYPVYNKSKFEFTQIAKNSNNIALVYKYKGLCYLYLDTYENFIKIFNNDPQHSFTRTHPSGE